MKNFPFEMLVTPGAVVTYNNSYFLLWNINDANKAQLISADGKRFTRTPNLDKLTWHKTLPTVFYINAKYMVDRNHRIFSLTTGKQVYKNNSPQKRAILALVDHTNISLINFDYRLGRIRKDEYLYAIIDEITEKGKTETVRVLDESYERDLDPDETIYRTNTDFVNTKPALGEIQNEMNEISDDEFRNLYPAQTKDSRYY
jgi:hypothetical protein